MYLTPSFYGLLNHFVRVYMIAMTDRIPKY